MSPEKEKAIKKHFDKAIRKFKVEALKLAIENEHPYIESLLESLLIHMNHNIRLTTADIRQNEKKFLELI